MEGSACRRFLFSNAMLELLWLEDETEARNEQTRVTKLWERFAAAGQIASPLGVVLRAAPGTEPVCPWRSWSYRPQTMPGLELDLAADAELAEPMWCYMKSGRAPAEWPRERLQPLDHPAGFREITRVLIGCPDAKEGSMTSTMAHNGVIALSNRGGTLAGITVRRRLPSDDAGFPAGPATDFSCLIDRLPIGRFLSRPTGSPRPDCPPISRTRLGIRVVRFLAVRGSLVRI